MISFVLLVLILGSVRSFTVPSRWLSARTATRRPTVACSGVNKPDEVYIGNLPPNCDESQLSNMLQQKGVTGCRDVSVSAYGTSDGEKFGSIKFDSSGLATAAVRGLSGVRVGEVEVDVSLMPNVSTIRVCVDGTDDEKKELRNRLREVLPREFYDRVKPILIRGQLKAVLFLCKSPELARRALQLLSKFLGMKHHKCSLYYNPERNLHKLLVKNLLTSIKSEDLRKIMKSVIGPDVRCDVPVNFDGTNRGHAFLSFNTEEQAEVALERLQGIKLMDRPMIVSFVDNRPLSQVMFLGNVDPMESTESIERLCRDALGGSGEIEVSVDRMFRPNGDHTPYCRVSFDSTEVRDKCMSVLNGTRWGDRVLYCSELKQLLPMLFIKSFPLSAYGKDTLSLLDSLIGEKCVKGITLNGKHRTGDTPGAFVSVYTEDQAARAIQKLNGQVVDGTTLRVERSTS